MAISEPMKQLAVLIDGDNISAGLAKVLFAEVAKLGSIAIRRVYARSSGINDWRDQAKAHCISLRETMAGKNSTDMELAVDAMDLLHRGKLDGYCIVSSDRDFGPLARRLREDGVLVAGYGMQKVALEVRAAFDSFTVLKAPTTELPKVEKAVAAVVARTLPSPQMARARSLLLQAFHRLNRGEWVPLNDVLKEVRAVEPGFTARDYGFAKPISVVRKTECFDDELIGGTTMLRVRPTFPVMIAEAAA